MKTKYTLFIALIILSLISCNNQKQQNQTTPVPAESGETFNFVSADKSYNFELQYTESGIRLKDVAHNKTYTMDRVRTASGERYVDDEGNVFWSKGKAFTFYKGDEIITQGLLAENPEQSIFGNYVDDTYAIRHEGYDWVAVSVKEGANNSINVSVRSRADKKKPTCSFDAQAFKTDDNTYESVNDGKTIVYTFSNDSITISTKNKADENMLYFFCSGGATFAGSYKKIDEPLDASQIDQTSFIQILSLQGVGFTVSSIRKNDINTFTVTTFGLPNDYNETFEIIGSRVTGAEVEDLNADGSPELFVYTQSDGSGSYGKVHAFSVNNLKSMSMVNFPPVAENAELNKGYMGHDEFAVVENRLVQRFPMYNDGDSNANPTGGTRQISYKLTEGEAMRQLKVDKVSEY
ncbi:PliI family lysozyme inhibitor of I-type lysozyme [uncultured Draconibacterium sp.]|uniref:PliI family lysozyme inhibitor of I-type lysozyme n=1 Tax=uncultured Draconibacterium sp. TaxID=1573823 RepID=UPI0025D4F79F|nr:PliI family lysozyme inhibitor of I-type lysozyme [uncultured Draconibacterium sp.]